MSATILVLTLLLCVAVSAILVRVTRLPLPLTQIALGVAVSIPEFGLHIDLEPHLFLLLFVPPLLFADGWRMPKREFFRLRERILGLALGLVLFTVVAVGYLINWMIPSLPLAASFALAAVLSPTDAVAVSALAGRAGIPKRLMYTLEGEALMNDASGLTAFKFAIAAAVTGAFSLTQASISFAVVAIGGLGVGVLLGWALGAFQQWLAGWTRVEAQGSIAMVLLLPFAAYLMAEELGVSGILAAVAAGMALNLKSTQMAPGAQTRIASTHIWSMIEYVLNGVIFVLLGLQLPEIVGKGLEYSYHDQGLSGPVWLIAYALAIAAALIVTRLVWVWLLLHVTRFYASWRGDQPTPGPRGKPRRRLFFATGLAGVRGAITLAGVLSVPFVLENGEPFPGRDLMIFLATTVIVISLLIAAVGLPLLLRGITIEDDPEVEEERNARLRASEAAIAAVGEAARRIDAQRAQGEVAPLAADAAGPLIASYELRMQGLRQDQGVPETVAERSRAELELRMVAIDAERRELSRLHRSEAINERVYNDLLYELDVREAALKPGKTGHA